VPTGLSRYRLSRLICRRPNFGSEREPGAGFHRKQGLVQWYGVNRDTLARAPAAAVSWRARRWMRRAK
jgi:hypothetical protein